MCIPFDVEQAYGKKRIMVRADIKIKIYHGSLVHSRMASAKISSR